MDTRERDAMICRSCGNEERASEGYPCSNCGTFVCLMCTLRGITLCATCAAREAGLGTPQSTPVVEPPAPPPAPSWLED